MRIVAVLSLLLSVALAAPEHHFSAAEACSATKCVAPDCRCASTKPPGDLDTKDIPQFVFFTFDDAVQVTNYEIYTDIFYNRNNSDGCPVQATFFLAHEYTDYTKVHDLYIQGHDIALHSITHQASTDYWKTISMDALNDEFGGEKQIVTTFANIPEEKIKGMRLPFLQLSGDNTFEIAKDIGLEYDCSWPTQTFRNPGLWPYTLDYKSNQDCPIGPCPSSSVPGVWVVPMIDWTDQANVVCSMVDACVQIPDDDADALTQWFIDNFNVQYNGNRAPFGFYVHAAYFNVNPIRLQAYKKFVDYLLTQENVFLVSPSRAIEWIKNPVPVGSEGWPECPQVTVTDCQPITCPLKKDDLTYYMTFCGTKCPNVYPWIGNPLGE